MDWKYGGLKCYRRFLFPRNCMGNFSQAIPT
uniref:Uncharacterized protein n=1 Tax=Arundo donax TaxID=35708 RepID=A0A0A9FGN3_ARUDO